jgi:hypothetical protein
MQGFFGRYSKKRKKELQNDAFSGGIFMNLCLRNINNYYSFLFLRGSSRGARRAPNKRIQGFFGRYSKKRKKELHIMIFSEGIFRESLLQSYK